MRFAIAALLSAACATSATAQNRIWRPDDRITISAFAGVGALTRDARRIYIATTGGLAVYDYSLRRFEPPITAEDGFPQHEQPSAAAYEPLGSEVWIGTAQGSVYRWRGAPWRFESVAAALPPISAIIVATQGIDDFIYIRAGSEWLRARRTSFGVSPVPAAQLPAEVVRRFAAISSLDPALNPFRALLGLDRSGRRWPITSFVPGDTRDSFWIGTRGGFAFHFDALRQSSDWLWYGALARGASALAVTDSGIWIGGDGRGPRDGLVHASHDLQRWSVYDAQDGAPRARINDIVESGSALHVAARDGVYQLKSRRWSRLIVDEAVSIAAAGHRVYAVTRSGVLEVGAGTTVIRNSNLTRVRMLRDSLWMIAPNAIIKHNPGDTTWVAVDTNALPRTRLIDAVELGMATYVLTLDALHLLGDQAGRVALPLEIGRARSAMASDSVIWVAGDNGAAAFNPVNRVWQSFVVGRDFPEGPVLAIAPQGDFAWLATPAGAVRLQLRP